MWRIFVVKLADTRGKLLVVEIISSVKMSQTQVQKLIHGYQKKPSRSIKEKMKIFEPQVTSYYNLFISAADSNVTIELCFRESNTIRAQHCFMVFFKTKKLLKITTLCNIMNYLKKCKPKNLSSSSLCIRFVTCRWRFGRKLSWSRNDFVKYCARRGRPYLAQEAHQSLPRVIGQA